MFENTDQGPIDDYGVNATIRYTCQESGQRFIDGYEAKTLICSGDGEWTGITDGCQSKCMPWIFLFCVFMPRFSV